MKISFHPLFNIGFGFKFKWETKIHDRILIPFLRMFDFRFYFIFIPTH